MRTLQVSDETWEKIKDTIEENEDEYEVNDMEEFIGKKVFIRTVTYHLTGLIDKKVGNFFHLKKAAWIADSGRFMEAIKEGKLNEVEPVGEAWVNINSITDMFPFNHDLPETQK